MRTISPRAGARTLPARLAACLTIVGGCLAAAATPAHAAGCVATFDAMEHRVTIGTCTADPDAPVTATISRTAAGAIEFNGQPIAGATVTNTDEIVYDGAGSADDEITVDMSNGRFAPGFTPEIVSTNEIELDIDGGGGANFLTILGRAAGGDTIFVGANGIDVSEDGDSDIGRANVTGAIAIDGQGGDDSLSGFYPGSTAVTTALILRGGDGNDRLRGGLSNDELEGGTGQDTLVDQRDGGFTLSPTVLSGNGTDTFAGIELAELSGNIGNDTIDASGYNGRVVLDGLGGDDKLFGGAGNDDLRGYTGDDIVEGGAGWDTAHENPMDDVTLTDSTMSGSGADSLTSIESITLFGGNADQTIDASAFSGVTLINSGGGADTLIGGTGFNTLVGGTGPDELRGGPGFDVLQGASGDDLIFSDDGKSEQVSCGDGDDTAHADALDGLNSCEQFDRGGAPGEPAPPGDPAQPADPGSPSDPAPPVTPMPDTVAPSLSRLSLARAVFRAAPSGSALASASVGTALRFTLSEHARVTFKFRRAVRSGRYVRVRGKLSYAAAAGDNRIVLRGRVGRRALAPGRYRLVARATDAAGNRSTVRRAAFRVLAAPA